MFVNDPREFDFLEIGLASPDRIRFWSYGEIEKPETINYRTFKPERKGLFCEKIFGPVKDWECSCGKYRRIRYRGIVCERCGVEVTHSKVRRERMGHIELAAPVTHIWFLKGIPGYLGIILDISSRHLEEVIYYDSYIITKVDDELAGQFAVGDLLSTLDYYELKEKHGTKLIAKIGAEAIKQLLSDLNISQLVRQLREDLGTSKGQKRLKLVKRLRILESIEKSGNLPEWMVLDAIPVMPPDLRPMVQLEGGRFATSDLNDLYRRVVNRNNRLKRLMDIGAPEMIIRNEKRMLQEAVDVLISNGKRGRAVTGSNGRPLKSLGNIIEGKQGRFRQNLLGKRVDYSARSVIVVGPHLDFNQCGLPKEMALELFKPFIIRKLVADGIALNVKNAKRKIEKKQVIVWSILEKVIKGKLVLLNRAPTLHRLGIQAFEPILVEGSAIQIHPLVCTAFNADFDGDQMAVHLPLSVEAQVECKMLIESTNNILSPSSGEPISTPTQDMILGLYYLTVDNKELKDEKRIYSDIEEALRALENGIIKFQSIIYLKINGKVTKTTPGRLIFNEAINEVLRGLNMPEFAYVNYVVGKKDISNLIYDIFIQYGNKVTSSVLNSLKRIGFKYSTLSGLSISIDDLTIPNTKPEIIKKALSEVEKLTDSEKKGIISVQDMKQRSSEVWRTTTQTVANHLQGAMGELNNVYIMAHSGARGNMDQVRQLAGMRGLMSDSQGRTIDIPIRSNFKEGLTLTEYFISAYGARKGLVDTALRTADSGYLTRRLVDVAQDIMIVEEDCGTKEGIRYTALKSGITTMIPLSNIVEGRYSLEDVKSLSTNKVLIKKDELITKEKARLLDKENIESVLCRSIHKCKSEKGICKLCYGIDLSTSKPISVGEAAGIIAAQSIGEPGTQLTMRTFHTGGVDLRKASIISITSPIDGKLSFPKSLKPIKVNDVDDSYWIVSDETNFEITKKDSTMKITVPQGSRLKVKDNSNLIKGDAIVEYDPNDSYIISEDAGTVYYDESKVSKIKESKNTVYTANESGLLFIYKKDTISKIPVSKVNSEKYSVYSTVIPSSITDSEINTSSIILNIEKNKDSKKKSDEYLLVVSPCCAYPFDRNSLIFVDNDVLVNKNQSIIYNRLSSNSDKTQDIVQGLPKVEELFEARKPKEASTLSEYDGIVEILDNNLYWSVLITTDDNVVKEYKFPKTSVLIVHSGKRVSKGDKLSHGPINPHELIKTKGLDVTRQYLSDEVQRVYCSQGVRINKKHIEVIVRQMTSKVVISEMGDTTFLINEMISKVLLDSVNSALPENSAPAVATPVLLGITRASLNTDSFVSASSFQQTASVLTKAAIEGQKDSMTGLKENVIIGKRIPAGTGIFSLHNINLNFLLNEEELNLESDNIDSSEDTNLEQTKKVTKKNESK